MPLDGLTLGFIARELQQTLGGARVERVTQPEKDMLLLALRNNGQNYKLILSASPSFARAHLTKGQFINPIDAPMFCMLMRKHLSGGRLMEISQLNGDRVLLLRFEAQDELGVMHPYEMYLEAMGRHSNLTLVRDGRIIDAIRHVTDDISRVRQALPGLPFTLPPAQDKLPPECTTEAALLARLSGCTGRLDKALSGCISGLSAIAARELSFRLTGAEQAELAAVQLPELCARLSSFLSRLPQMCSPSCTYPIRQIASGRQAACPPRWMNTTTAATAATACSSAPPAFAGWSKRIWNGARKSWLCRKRNCSTPTRWRITA